MIGRPLKMTVDMLVLIVGMKAGASNMALSRNRHVDLYPSGFVKTGQPVYRQRGLRLQPHLLRRSGHGTEKYR